MTTTPRPTLDDYRGFDYSLRVTADPEGGYVLDFPDLPGCMSQTDDLQEVGPIAEEIKRLWLESAYRQGIDIPRPSFPEEYSGKFNLRLPRSLHRRLAEAADADGVSLNQHVVALLSEGVASSRAEPASDEVLAHQRRLEQALAVLAGQVGEIHAQVAAYRVASTPRRQAERPELQVVVSAKNLITSVAA